MDFVKDVDTLSFQPGFGTLYSGPGRHGHAQAHQGQLSSKLPNQESHLGDARGGFLIGDAGRAHINLPAPGWGFFELMHPVYEFRVEHAQGTATEEQHSTQTVRAIPRSRIGLGGASPLHESELGQAP